MAKIEISDEIYDKIKEKIKDTEFDSVEKYIEYVLKQALGETEVYSKEDEEKVKERLKTLGYI